MNRKFNDLTGQTINHIKVQQRIREGYKSPHWLCNCVCGKELILPTVCLVNNNQQSCGCVARRQRKLQADKTGAPAARGAFSMLKSGAKRRGYTCTLSFNEFFNISLRNCEYCGIAPTNAVKPGNASHPFICNGIDRRDNTKGYTTENSVTCCSTCNYAKRGLTEAQWFSWISRLTNHFTKLK